MMMMMKGEASQSKKNKNKKSSAADRLTDTIFSWSLQDVFNENLFINKIGKIPDSFLSVEHYLGSYINPLLEETRAELHSSMEILYGAPFADVIAFEEAKPHGKKNYKFRVNDWRNKHSKGGKEPYKTLPGDIFVLANGKPETVGDLQRVGRSWAFLSLTKLNGNGGTTFTVKASKEIKHDFQKAQTSLCIVFLANFIPIRRIWEALHMSCNVEFLNKALCIDSEAKRWCDGCFKINNGIWDEKLVRNLSSELNESQTKAVLSCLHMMDCKRKSSLELIWGPPGTGKTKTTSTLLVTLLRMNYKTLVCAPTNVAITGVASRVLKMVLGTHGDDLFCSLGNILLFGTKERLNVGEDLEDIYLDARVEKLEKCFRSYGWRHSLSSMIDLLENSVSKYNDMLEIDSTKEKEESSISINEEKRNRNRNRNKNDCKVGKKKFPTFLEYVREKFNMTFSELREYFSIICTHTTKSYISGKIFQDMVSLIGSLASFQSLLCNKSVVSEVLEKLFSCAEVNEYLSCSFVDDTSLGINLRRKKCVSSMRSLRDSLNRLDFSWIKSQETIEKFCWESASVILCTVSSSYKLHRLKIKPTILIIDEAAQLKECESTIPLQLPGVQHAIFVGDEWQLPATVKSKVSEKAGFGRSLFERLSSQNHPKHLLNVQYRMHPSISIFPNSQFYHNQILDAAIVKMKSYKRKYLPGPMFGPYSFINIIGGIEQKDGDGRSRKNMVEVAVIMRILQKLYKAWVKSKCELSVGIVSPYAAQVVAIQDQLWNKYNERDGFQVKVKTVDGFQGGEEDIIIMSTVRCSGWHSLDFISKPQRTNVALTRARHCLWILGEERTLVNSQTVWTSIVTDAKNRKCFSNADSDEDLAKAITEVKKESGQFDDMIDKDSILFKRSKWKVFFSENFLMSFNKLEVVEAKRPVIKLLLKLSDGWRPRGPSVVSSVSLCENSLQIMSFKVEGLCILSTVDIVKEYSGYKQVLKIWDLLPHEEIPRLKNKLDIIFEKYTEEFINNCNEKCFEGKLEIPKSWPLSSNIVCFEDLSLHQVGNDYRSYFQNSRINESPLPMKFYSLSNCVVNHMLSDRDGRELDLPFEVPDQEREIILFNKSTFVLGRSGTGKTTVLSTKLFQKEYMHRLTMEGLYGAKSNGSGNVNKKNVVTRNSGKTTGNVLRQLFVTASPKLCDTVKHSISFLRSGSHSAESGMIDKDNIDNEDSEFKNIPDSFHDIPLNSYPLVITFHKFLMMLDGTLSKSYFQRFLDMDEDSQSQIPSSRSHTFHSFFRSKEVNYERFCSQYWPCFDSQFTKKLDPSCVFTQIVSHIKGSLQALETNDGKLTRKNYVMLSKECGSTLRRKKREMIYDIFQTYEKLKLENGEFDLADFVSDLHFRLRQEGYGSDKMDFVYIDEVQDLTMSQIALFKHVSSNLEEGFVFSGDVVKPTIGGIDCRIQDIRCVFDKKFALKPMMNKNGKGGHITHMFCLTQNFRSHADILKLSGSIIELLYHFFPQSIDIIEPETHMVPGEAPILLQAEKNENAIIKLFGKGDNLSKNAIGFGAEQVILVRDETTRQSIKDIVGKKALIVTILECKDLEFQDVLLYNFFGSSPLRNQWRLIYKYMNEQDMLDSTSPHFPLFNECKHRILLAELKKLYVAIACTKKRLWICDDTEFSKPMFDYWMKGCLVQVQKLDDSLALSMQVSSSPQEWKSRGVKLYYVHNYEMATVCFEKAHDTLWETKSKVAGLQAMADRMRTSNPEAANVFKTMGKFDSAASCYRNSGDYEQAGRIYLDKFGESGLQRAGECFFLAGHYEQSANAYARDNLFSECLNVCAKGLLFDKGLAYIQSWKQQAKQNSDVTSRGTEIEKIGQEFLESCALHYYKLENKNSMMRIVEAFDSMNSIRKFLRSLGCFDELMSLEEKSGNFVEAAEIAKLRGDILVVIDLLEKAGKFKEAATLVLSYVLANSLWSSGKKGWPLQLFKQKDNLLTKAKSFAKNESQEFYDFVCTEADIMTNKKCDLTMSKNQMIASQRHKSVRGEILSVRRVLEAHLDSKLTNYFWEEYLGHDHLMHSEEMTSEIHVSVESLVYFWNIWKDKILRIFEYLGHLQTRDVDEFTSYEEFCLDYLGVLRLSHNLGTNYVLLHPDADWAKNVEQIYVGSNGKLLLSTDVGEFVSAAQIYWSSEVLTAGFKVLHKLEAICSTFVTDKSDSLSRKCRTLTLIYEVAQFLLESQNLKRTCQNSDDLKKLIRLSTDFSGNIFPLDCQKSLVEDLVFFRGTDFCNNFLRQVIVEQCNSSNNLSYRQIGTVAVFVLGSSKLNDELFEKIIKRMDQNLSWKAFFELLHRSRGSYFSNSSLICRFHGVLVDAYNANRRGECDPISPGFFLYLVERLVIWSSSYKGYFYTTKSAFVEWLIYEEIHPQAKSSSNTSVGFQLSLLELLQFVIHVIKECLYNEQYMIDWINTSPSRDGKSYSLLVSRMVFIICLLHANFGMCSDLLFDVLARTRITKHLPSKFCDTLKSHFLNLNLNVLAKAFKQIDNSLVVASFGTYFSNPLFPDAMLVDLGANCCKNDIIRILFPKRFEASTGLSQASAMEACDSSRGIVSTSGSTAGTSSELNLVREQNSSILNKDETNPPMNLCFWEIFEAINSERNGREHGKLTSNAQTIKVDLEKYIGLLTAAVTGSLEKPLGREEKISSSEMVDMLYELKQLSAALDAREIFLVKELSKRLQSRKPRMEGILNQFFHKHTTDSGDTTLQATVKTSNQCDDDEKTTPEKISKSDKGESKVSEVSNVSTVSEARTNSEVSEPDTVKENKGKVAETKPKKKEGCHIL
ncbi:uncharacterized protein LOC133824159 [Humulus lupulus]|uniref:uncharacterized protein LOC133824159 n=1 Tax=Humulus lupulus TaxID=3486 RepID=UPI002B416D6E|nr:uncharacterized protein LOC133824159 [Humulus lupulus]